MVIAVPFCQQNNWPGAEEVLENMEFIQDCVFRSTLREDLYMAGSGDSNMSKILS